MQTPLDRISRASAVPGWMTPEELRWLESTARGKQLVVEFGSWRGRSSVALAAAVKLVCVDTFVDMPQEDGTGESTYPHFCRSIADDADHVEAIVASLASEATAAMLRKRFGNSADVVFIDASHDEQSVLRDISIAASLVRPGGILCGHDFSPAWPGVVSAVKNNFKDFQRGPGSIWWVEP